MAHMLAAMASTRLTCHLPRPLVALEASGLRRLRPAVSGSDSDLGRSMRMSTIGSTVRGCRRLCCGGGWIRSCLERQDMSGGADVGGDCSPGRESQRQEDSGECVTVRKNWQMNAVQLREKVSKLGRAGLLAYGLFSSVIYTTFFFIAFLAFEKSTGQNPANNLKGCLGGMLTMWTGNNFTRPFRVAGAAAMAPCMDKVLKKTQKVFKFEDEASAFLFLIILLFALCGSSVGLLILSRKGR